MSLTPLGKRGKARHRSHAMWRLLGGWATWRNRCFIAFWVIFDKNYFLYCIWTQMCPALINFFPLEWSLSRDVKCCSQMFRLEISRNRCAARQHTLNLLFKIPFVTINGDVRDMPSPGFDKVPGTLEIGPRPTKNRGPSSSSKVRSLLKTRTKKKKSWN